MGNSTGSLTPSSFFNVYHWGNFKGNPDKWMEKYFDAFLYLANEWAEGEGWLVICPKVSLEASPMNILS